MNDAFAGKLKIPFFSLPSLREYSLNLGVGFWIWALCPDPEKTTKPAPEDADSPDVDSPGSCRCFHQARPVQAKALTAAGGFGGSGMNMLVFPAEKQVCRQAGFPEKF